MQVLSYPECAALERRDVGGKVHALARMAGAGLPVPDGFCLRLPAGPVAREERRAIEEAARVLAARTGARRYAVRSSGAFEDSAEQSCAGRFATFLDVPLEGLHEAVGGCLEAMAGGDSGKPGAAASVLVQEMVPVRIGGVAFGCDPVTGDPGMLVIEYCLGPTSRVVDGRHAPRRIRLDRAGAAGGLASASDDAEAAPALRALLELVPRVESLLGGVQDIEWGWDGRSLRLLQARPVTTLRDPAWDQGWLFGYGGSRAVGNPRTLWTTANVGEALPGVVTPLSASLVERLQAHVFGRLMDWTPLVIRRGDAVFGAVRGRACICLTSVLEIVSQMPFGRISPVYVSRQIGAPVEALPPVKRRSKADFLWRLPVKAPSALLLVCGMAGAAERVRRSVMRRVGELRERDLSSLGPAELAALCEDTVTRAGEAFFHHALIGAASSNLTHLAEGLLALRFGHGEAARRLNGLLAGLGGVESAAPAALLWRMAARHRGPARRLGLTDADWPDARRAMEASDEGRALLADIGAFLARYGYRGASEVELFSPRWDERPELIWDALRRLLRMPGEAAAKVGASAAEPEGIGGGAAPPPEQAAEEDEAERPGRLRRAVGRLVWMLAGPLLLERTRALLRLRENTRAAVTALVGQLRRMVSQAGTELAARSALVSAQDVFFLTLGEIERGLRDPDAAASRGALEARILRRRQRRAYWLSRGEPPLVFVGDRAPDEGPAAAPEPGDLRGVPVSVGRAEGPACVIADPDRAGQLPPGAILIAPFVNPGWAPLYCVAGGLVAETGGMMSHGAIIARELGLPAVVGVRDAMRRIRDGQRVRVDGGVGTVRLLD